MGALNIRKKFGRTDAGQSLLELLIALGIGALLMSGAVVAIGLALQISARNKSFQVALFLVQEALDGIATVADADWIMNIETLDPPPATYRLVPLGGGLSVASGIEAIIVDGVSYDRFITIDAAYRDNDGALAAAGAADPSTKKAIAVVRWPEGGTTSEVSLVRYISRSENRSTRQTDWSGGAGQSALFVNPDKYAAADASVDVTSTNGSIKLRLQ